MNAPLAADHRAHRRAQPLRHTEGHRVDGPDELPGVTPERDRGVEEPRAVEMDAHAGAVGHRGHRGDLLRRAAGAAVTVVRVLQAHQAGGRDVDVGRADRLLHLGRREKAALGLQREHLHAADHRAAADLGVEDVGVEVEDDFLAGLGLREHGEEVAHGAGADEERGLLAQPLGRHRLQTLDGGILVPHVVADFGAGHGLAHLRGRPRHRVGAEIDEVVHGVTSSCEDAGRPGVPTRCTSNPRRAAAAAHRLPCSCPRRS